MLLPHRLTSFNSNNIPDSAIKQEIARKAELIKSNSERISKGLEPLVIESSTSDNSNGTTKDPEVTKVELGKGIGKVDKPNSYQHVQSQIQSVFAQMQGDRLAEIAKLARLDHHVIYIFKKHPKKPKMGEKPNKGDILTEQTVYYSEIPNRKHIEWEKLRGRIAKLQRVKTDMTATVDSEGNLVPPKLTENIPARTGLTDFDFANIDEMIDELNTKLYKDMAYEMYAIPEEIYLDLETTSFKNAIEAGMYREAYGLAGNSKNSIGYLT